MKYLLFIFLSLSNFTLCNEKKSENDQALVLKGFHKFKVVTLLPFFEKMDQKLIFDTMVKSFEKYGQVSISEKKSMFQSLLQLDATDPICFFVIDKDEDQIKGTLEILAEVEIVANNSKTICSIWKKNLSAFIPSTIENQTEQTIANLLHQMVDEVSKDWEKANKDSKQPVFQINKFQHL